MMVPPRVRGVVPCSDPGAILAPRELEYLKLRGHGETLRGTAEHMGISESMVKTYLERVHRKLGVASTIEAFAAMGWLKVPE